jgi:hypothetical protein
MYIESDYLVILIFYYESLLVLNVSIVLHKFALIGASNPSKIAKTPFPLLHPRVQLLFC